MAADVAQSDNLEALAEAAKTGDIKGAATLIENDKAFKSVADVAKTAALDEVIGDLGENE